MHEVRLPKLGTQIVNAEITEWVAAEGEKVNEYLDFAINEFREMKMQPSLERALKHNEILGA